MSVEVVKTIKVETSGADKSVKSLRDNIKQLRNDLLNLEKGTQEYDDTLNQIIKDETELTQVMKAGKDEVAQALKKVTGEYVTQKQELKALKVELEQLEPGTDAYNEKFARAAEITANLKQQQELLKYSSNDLGDQLSNMRGIAANVAAGFSAAQAAIGLFGGESKEVQQAMLKVQQAIALVQGLEGLDGFIKRTKGLSSAIQGWVTQSKAATVQTTAQATATKAAATATNAETVATQGATVAQKGLNAAMKANPVGIVVAALALLITNWKKIVEWIGKAVGGFDKLNKAMNKFKAAVSGVGNAIKKVLLVPIKEAINYVTTLGKVLWDALTFNWGEIKEDIKNGIDGAIDIVKDGYNVAANYAEGKEKEITRQVEKETKERAEKRADELDYAIRLKEAQKGSDWKYTEEGKAMYKEYFDALEQMYKDDTEKYREYQIEKASYESDVAEHEEKVRQDNYNKAQEAAKKAKEELKKIESDYQSKVASKVGSTYTASFDELKESLSAFSAYYKSISNSLSGSTSSTLKMWSKEIDSFLGDTKNKLSVFANETASVMFGFSVKEIQSVLNPNYFDTYFKDALGNLLPEEEIKKKWKRIVDSITEVTEDGMVSSSFGDAIQMRMDVELQRLKKLSSAKLNDALENSSDEANRKINDEIIKIFQKNIKPTVEEQIAELQLEIGKKTVKLDFEIETGMDFNSFIGSGVFNPIEGFNKQAAELEKAADIYENSLKQVNAQLDFYQKTIEHVNEHPELIPSDEYENALRMVEQLTNQAQQLYVDYYNTNAEIRDRYFAEDLQKIQTNAANEERLILQHYNELYTANSNYLNGRRQLSGVIMEHDIQAAEETYQVQKNALQEQLNMYQSYLQDVTVAGEQRVEAERMVAELIAQIEEGEVAHTREMNELRIQSFQMWYSYAQDAVGGISDLIGSLADAYEADLKYQVDHNQKSQEEAEDYYEHTIKPMRRAEVIVNTIAGAIGAYLQAVSTYPPPAGEILGGISAAAVAAAGYAQVRAIDNQHFGNGSSNLQSAIATPQTQVYEPSYVENPTNDNEVSNLRNAYMEQPIKAYVVESEITDAQRVAGTRSREASF